MSLILLVAAVVCAALVIALVVSGAADDPLRPLEDAAAKTEREFRDYVSGELHKAMAGDANTEQWAVNLVAQWNKKHGVE